MSPATQTSGGVQQNAQQNAQKAAPRPAAVGRRLAPPARHAPAVQGIVGNHGALRRPDAAEHEARHTARRLAAGLPAPAHVRARGASRPLAMPSSPLGAGMPLPAVILAAMEAALDADFGTVRVHVSRRATVSAREARARAVTTGEHIAFGHGMYRPETSDGRMLIAHELTHVLQQRASGVVRPQFDDDDLVGGSMTDAGTEPGARTAPPIYLRVDMRGITVSSPGRRYDRGKLKPPQLMAMVLRRLVTDYEPGLEDDLLARLPNDSSVQRFGDLASDREAGEDDRMQDVFIELGPLGIIIHTLQQLGHRELNLTDDQRRILFLGNEIAGWWNRTPWLREEFPWYTPRMFMSHVAMHGQLIADMESSETPEAFLEAELVFTNHLLEAVGLLDEVRLDLTLAEDPEAGGVWKAIWGEPGASPPATVQRQDIAIQLMAYYWTQRALGREALINAEQRVEFMRRFSRWLGRTAPAATVSDITQRLLEQPGQATDPPFPATLEAFPPPHGPARVVPAAKDRRFEFNVQFPDVYSAFTHYHYQWDVIRWEADAGQEQTAVEAVASGETDAATRTEGAEEASMGDVVGARLGRDLRDAATDIERIHDTFGPAGVVVSSPLLFNALILRPLGTLIESFVDLVTLSAGPGRRERPIQFPEPGVFVVRVSAIPVVDDAAEVRRPPSVAYVAVFAQDEADFARAQLGEAIDAAEEQDQARAEYVETVRQALAEETDPEVRAALEQLLVDARRDESYWPRIQAMKERLDTRITEIDAELARLRRERPAGGAARREADAAISVLQAERDRMDTQRNQLEDLLNTRTGRSRDYPQLGFARPLYVGFVSDDGEARQLTMEWASLNPEEASATTRLAAPSGSQFVVVSDHTSANGGVDEGYGATQDAAIVRAVRAVLESRFGYGRGEASIRLPGGSTHDLRIERDLPALTSEAIENISLVITVAAVAAAPFTAGASLSILVPIGIIGGGHAAYRMYTRYEASTLRWDMQTAMDIVDIVGAVVQGGAAVRGARAGMRASRFGRVLAVSYEFAEEGTGYVLLGLGLEQQLKDIEENQTWSDGEKRARRVMALGSAMLQAGIMVGQRVFKQGADDLRAAREELGRLTDETTTGDDTSTGTPPASTAPPADTTTTPRETSPAPAPVDTTSAPTAPETRVSETGTPADRPTETPAPEGAPPETTTPETGTPETGAADTTTREIATPEAGTPETTPDTATPEVATSEATTPETAPTEVTTPETPTPDVSTPEAAIPEATPAPEAVTPEMGGGQPTPDITTPADVSPAPEVVAAPPVEVAPQVEGTSGGGVPSGPAPVATPRTRAELQQAVAGLIADGRFTDPTLEAAYGRYEGNANRAEWAWRTRGEPLARLRELLGPDFRPPRTPAATETPAAAPEAAVQSDASGMAVSETAAAPATAAEVAAPQPGGPEAPSPEVGTPEVATPEAGTPEIAAPEVGTPEAPTPDVGTPETLAPEVGTPEAVAQEPGTLQATTPETATPATATTTPETTATPEAATPEIATPEPATPEVTPQGSTSQPASPLAGVSRATLRRRVGDPQAPQDLAAHAELDRRYGELPIRELVQMVRRDTRWDGPYARRALKRGEGRRGTVAEYLAEVTGIDQLRQMALHDPAAADALVERYYRDFTPQQLENMAAGGDQTAQYVLDNPRRGPHMDTDAEARLVEAVWEQRRTASEAEETRALESDDPAVRAAAQARAQAAREAGTVGAMETDIPGIEAQVVRGSPNAPTEIDPNQPRHVQPATDVALAQFHAEEQLLNRLISSIAEAGLTSEQLNGRTVRIVVDQRVCSYCLSGLASGEHGGTLRQFAERYPGLRVEITDLRTGDFMVLADGRREVHHRRAGTLDDE